MKLTHALTALPLALGLACAAHAAHAAHEVDSLELDSPTPAKNAKVLASGVCHREDASVRFFFEQDGEKRGFETQVDIQQGEFDAQLNLASVDAQDGIAWIYAKCSDGKTLTTAVKIGAVAFGAAHSPLGGSPFVREAPSDGTGYSSGPLELRGEPPRVGGEVVLHSICRAEGGQVKLFLVQNGETIALNSLALASKIPFNAQVKLESDEVEAGKAHFVALCPDGLLLTTHAAIAQADDAM